MSVFANDFLPARTFESRANSVEWDVRVFVREFDDGKEEDDRITQRNGRIDHGRTAPRSNTPCATDPDRFDPEYCSGSPAANRIWPGRFE